MRVVITGGTGLIGRALAEDLAGAGHEVVVLSRDAGKAAGAPSGVRVERWDARTGKGWAHLAEMGFHFRFPEINGALYDLLRGR